jgi:hypothetical protein
MILYKTTHLYALSCILAVLLCAGLDARNIAFRERIIQGLGGGVLRIVPEDFSTERTTYIISAKCDAKGQTIHIPRKCNLVFSGEGCIMNAIMVFDGTWLDNPCFKNILSYSGSINNRSLHLKDFGTLDDTNLLFFIFSQIGNSTIVTFEDRKYYIDALKFKKEIINDDSFINIIEKRKIIIDGNGAEIIDSASDRLLGGTLFSVFKFTSCSKITINNLSYSWTNNPILHPRVKGIIFIRTINQCKSFTIDVSVNNCGRGVYSGRWNDISGHPRRGLCDSEIIVHASKVGYPIAIEKGDNLVIKDYYEIVHRGLYLAGVTNSVVLVSGKEAFSTKVHLLLTDTMDADGWYFCENIDATVIDRGTSELSDMVLMAYCQFYPLTYEQFVGRPKYDIKNIKLHLFTPSGTETSYELLNIDDLAGLGDRINVSVDGKFYHKGKNDRLYRILHQPKGTVVFNNIDCINNYVVYSGDIPNDCNLVFNNCSNILFEWSSQKTPTNGSIEFHKCTFKRKVERVDRLKTDLFVDLRVD